MALALELDGLPPPVVKALSPDAPPQLRKMAAKGVLPGAKPQDVVTVLAAFTASDDRELSATAEETLGKLPPAVLTGALSAELQPSVIGVLAQRLFGDIKAVEQLVRQPRIDTAALELLAERANENIGEIIATNEARLLENPTVIEKLYMNKRVRMSTADRLVELAIRNRIELGIPAFKELSLAMQNELIIESDGEPTPDDVLFKETDAVAEAVKIDLAQEDAFEADDEGKEKLIDKLLPVHAQIAQMNVSQKIRRAILGTAAERMLLVRDMNRLVAVAAASSPQLSDNEAVRISASRQVADDVLRIIARNKDFTRNYQVKLNLVLNPRTPFTFSSGLIPLLRDSDLKNIVKSKGVPQAIATSARQQMAKKQTGKKSG